MKIKNMKIFNTIQNSGTVMHFLDQNLKIKNGEQLKHRNIMNKILWIYGSSSNLEGGSAECPAYLHNNTLAHGTVTNDVGLHE